MDSVWNGEAPRNVLSNETIRAALARANSAASMDTPPSPKRTSTSSSTKSRPSTERRSTSSRTPKHANCDCVDCRELSYRDKQGAERTDKNGDRVREWDGDEAPPVHCHVQPGLFDEEERPAGPRRTSTHGSSRSERRGSPKFEKTNTYTTINKDGDHVEEWDGAEAPKVRTHYDWDAQENKSHR